MSSANLGSSRKGRPLAWLAWTAVGLLAGSCCVLAILQYRWITEFSAAERQRLHEQLQDGLNVLSRQFNQEISTASASLMPTASEIAELGVERAYEARYGQSQQSRGKLFRRVALAIPDRGDIDLKMLNPETGRFASADWPADWDAMHRRMISRIGYSADRGEPFDSRESTLIEIPRFVSDGDGGPMVEREWLIEELNTDYIRDAMLPELMNRALGSGKLDYDAAVVLASEPSVTVFGPRIDSPPDGSVALLQNRMASPQRMRRPGPPRGPGPPHDDRPPRFGPRPPDQGPPPMDFGDGRWLLLVRHHEGSLEALVERARFRNLAASGGLLLLILLTVALLVRFSRQSQRLAEQQMNFVAGVSHELRTPLTVIRTAAFNLRGRLTSRPEQVERYGELIQEESEKLTVLVDQVLTFASSEAGHVVRDRRAGGGGDADRFEPRIEPRRRESRASSGMFTSGLPPVLADKRQ